MGGGRRWEEVQGTKYVVGTRRPEEGLVTIEKAGDERWEEELATREVLGPGEVDGLPVAEDTGDNDGTKPTVDLEAEVGTGITNGSAVGRSFETFNIDCWVSATFIFAGSFVDLHSLGRGLTVMISPLKEARLSLYTSLLAVLN